MNDSALEQLLARADQTAPPPGVADDLSTRVRKRLRRRKTTSRAAAGILVLCIAAVIATHRKPHSRETIVKAAPILTAPQIAQLQAEAARFASEAAVHERVADALLAGRRRSLEEERWAAAATLADPVQAIALARDQAAQTLFRDATRLPVNSGDALQAYRQVATLFADTPAGKLAVQKLKSQGV